MLVLFYQKQNHVDKLHIVIAFRDVQFGLVVFSKLLVDFSKPLADFSQFLSKAQFLFP